MALFHLQLPSDSTRTSMSAPVSKTRNDQLLYFATSEHSCTHCTNVCLSREIVCDFLLVGRGRFCSRTFFVPCGPDPCFAESCDDVCAAVCFLPTSFRKSLQCCVESGSKNIVHESYRTEFCALLGLPQTFPCSFQATQISQYASRDKLKSRKTTYSVAGVSL